MTEEGFSRSKIIKKSFFGAEDDIRHKHDGCPRGSALKSRLEMHKSGWDPALGTGLSSGAVWWLPLRFEFSQVKRNLWGALKEFYSIDAL